MQDDDDEYVNGYDEATHTLFWDDDRSKNDGVGLLSLISKHATALRHIHIRCGLWMSFLCPFPHRCYAETLAMR